MLENMEKSQIIEQIEDKFRGIACVISYIYELIPHGFNTDHDEVLCLHISNNPENPRLCK